MMDKPAGKPPEPEKTSLLATFTRGYSGPVSQVALSAMSAWMIVTGLKGLAGFEVNARTALADLLGVIIVIALLRWARTRFNIR
ncbi:hypothetical protein [Noviherbaspirillum galbum]|uniref:Uncharacterized protein n=1 Tax=Noviherbaspirillum galbum TaxID=2709383 RepID=A0A6B3SSZ0_9BURK|nr:hypothetical protein [Noviherbaspirillum galbum]NEX63771.1 hypothetical protein [Noviherbaspirillum galbum]